MRTLIINADGLGMNNQRSHGILMCHENGSVSSASLVANMSESEKAARHAQERDLPTGLHLNLTLGSPLSQASDVPSLITTDGFFTGLASLERMLREGEIGATHLEREMRAQIEWFLEFRGFPTHVDSHEHIHVLEPIARVLVTLLDQYGIAYVRLPREPAVPFGYQISPEQTAEIAKISTRAERAAALFKAHDIRSADHFRGLAFQGNASMRNMRHTVGRLEEGITELMVHPGSPNPSGDPFDRDPQRQTEINILQNPEVPEMLKEREIRLCSYADLL